ncbi:MAG TPA: ribonuclease HI family protein [Tepidisphaeraceae bacterium]|nr:ribonuclease HI family protein [Tepidisphaeraceae bacterium]
MAIQETLTLNFDGGSRGNPGPAGVGVVICAADGTQLVTLGRFIGRATNNAAEYRALIAGLQEAKKLGGTRLHIRGDSELIIKQMRGEYRVKNPDLRPLWQQAQELVSQFQSAVFEHNLRGKNALADRLANLAMDRKADVTELDAPPSPAPSPRSSTQPRSSSAASASAEQFACPRCGCVIEVKQSSSSSDGSPFICRCGSSMSPSQ